MPVIAGFPESLASVGLQAVWELHHHRNLCVAAGEMSGKNEDARNRSLWRLNGGKLAGAWTKHRPVQPSNESPGRPESSIFKLCRRWSFESPRFSHPSAAL